MIRGRGPRDGCGEGQGQVLLKYRLLEFRDGTVDITKLIIFVYAKLQLLTRISRSEMTKVSMKGTPAPKMTMRFN